MGQTWADIVKQSSNNDSQNVHISSQAQNDSNLAKIMKQALEQTKKDEEIKNERESSSHVKIT